MSQSISVPDHHDGETVEHFILHSLGLGPRSRIKRAFQEGKILVNAKSCKRHFTVHTFDIVEIAADDIFSRESMIVLANPSLPPTVICETTDLLAIAKPSGQNSHPLIPTEVDTALNSIAANYPETAEPMSKDKPLDGGLIHRLDRGTSGALVCARTHEAWHILKDIWKSKGIEKTYLAWVAGKFQLTGTMKIFLAHDPKNKKRMIASIEPPRGLDSWRAVTSILPILTAGDATLVLVRIHTGVTHQIRATLSNLGHPVLGDAIYTGTASKLANLEPTAFDPETGQALTQLRDRVVHLKKFEKGPQLKELPTDGFFLHALCLRWQQSLEKSKQGLSPDSAQALAQGIFCEPPDYFGH